MRQVAGPFDLNSCHGRLEVFRVIVSIFHLLRLMSPRVVRPTLKVCLLIRHMYVHVDCRLVDCLTSHVARVSCRWVWRQHHVVYRHTNGVCRQDVRHHTNTLRHRAQAPIQPERLPRPGSRGPEAECSWRHRTYYCHHSHALVPGRCPPPSQHSEAKALPPGMLSLLAPSRRSTRSLIFRSPPHVPFCGPLRLTIAFFPSVLVCVSRPCRSAACM